MTPQKISILVGSKNPVKIAAAQEAIQQYFPSAAIHCAGIDAPSGVAQQPMSAEETKKGAINRVKYCQQHAINTGIEADYYVAMEGGVDMFDHGAATFAYMALINNNQLSIGRSALLPLPTKVYEALEAGEELGHVMDRLFNTHNIKQKGGAIGLLTQNLATRGSIYTQAIILAMAPFINREFYAD
ncbi:inosine/xanthosine triphosphatase [Shewanella gaetbuli]|uniref:Inosine/xanthosine triphosphatase n=1 Tax=Shewanella gaetbuli TaxID=220752 RepID=A0A9X1ZNJ4_9GAMM|nr:inosine/xanthosine triphosphatase [Shewanella gaetbuli]MCL1141163.1 inosine/xanthosine triphosphatase [Shewanella gaetbuli]